MSSEKQSAFEEQFPLPPGVKLRARKFGSNPVSDFKSVPVQGQGASTGTPLPPLVLSWKDSGLGLTVLLREQATTGQLVADVSCTDPAMLHRAAVAVALVGKDE